MNDTHAAKPDYLQADKVSSTRALTLYAVGVVIGLILGGIGLFTARGTTTNKVPEENMALVNQRPILRSDFVTQLENETGKPLAETTRAEQIRVLDEMIREELFVQRGLELDYAETDQETRNALYNIVEQQVTAAVNFGKASEQDLQEYYDKHKQDFKNGDRQLTLEEAHQEVMTAQFHAEKDRVLNNMMTFLRNRSTILIADDYKQDYKPQDIRSDI